MDGLGRIGSLGLEDNVFNSNVIFIILNIYHRWVIDIQFMCLFVYIMNYNNLPLPQMERMEFGRLRAAYMLPPSLLVPAVQTMSSPILIIN